MRHFALVVTAAAVLSVGCRDQQPLQPAANAGPAYMISDGAHSGGNSHFFFLPPLVPDPSAFFHAGTFNTRLTPVVEVCQLKADLTDCLLDGASHPVLVFGPATMALDLTNQQYIRNWDTKSPALDASLFYRIIVRGAPRGSALGFLDVDPVDQGMRNLRTGDVVQFQDGRVLPIKVRVEDGAFGSTNPDHIEQVVANHITTPTGTLDVTTNTFFAGARFFDGWLPSGIDQVVVIIERIPVNDATGTTCLESGLLEREGCYRFRTDPDLHGLGPDGTDLTFRVNVIAGVCYENPIHTTDPYQLFRREENSDGRPVGPTVALEDVEAPFLSCDEFKRSQISLSQALRSGSMRAVASAGWNALVRRIGRVVTPQALHAVDLGAGGSTDGFSRFGYARGVTMVKVAATDNQVALTGRKVLVDPTVCLAKLHPSPGPLVGERVAFTVTGGGGTVGGGHSVTVNTGTDGCAPAPWTLASSSGVNTLQATAFAFGSPQAFAATGFSFSSLDAGERLSCYVASTGVAYCWGSNSFGQLGNGGTADASVPTVVSGGLTLVAISSTFNYTCALGSDGHASCWGQNRSGRLGDGTTTDRSTPVPVSGGRTFTSISTGGLHSCGLTPIGTAYCWGDNRFGQLGSSTVETCTDPFGTTPCSSTPAAVSGGLTFRAISAGFFHTCGLRDDGAAFCWGRGILGNLGTGTRTNAAAPVPVTGGLTFESLTAGAEYTCGLATGGVAYCWGVNSGGQLGLGPTNLSGVSVPTPVSGELRFLFLSAANENIIVGHTCGVAVGGAAYCWGGDLAGEIGAPTSETCPPFGPCATSPVPVSGGLSFTTTTAGIDHTCGLATTGDAYCWGGNNRGQLGNGTVTNRSVPTAVAFPLPRYACSLEPTLHSIEGAVSTAIHFVNRTAGTVTVYWLNYDGQRVFYNTLPAGQSYDQQTYLTHPWVVTDASGACLGIWLPTAAPGTALIGG